MNTKTPHNVLIIESGEGVGGSAFSMYRIVKYLEKSRFRPFVFVYYRTPVFADIESLGVPVVVLPLTAPFPRIIAEKGTFLGQIRNYISLYGNLIVETLVNGFRLARFIRKNRIDIVHANNGIFENFAAVFAARLTGTPCICHIRGTEPLMKLERAVGNWVHKIVVLNEEMREEYSNSFGADKVHLIMNGVDLDLFSDPDPGKIRNEFSIDTDRFCVGTFARLDEGKGIPEFLQAAAQARVGRDDLTFFVGGSAKEGSSFESTLHAQAEQLGLGEHVVFAGWRNDVNDCMAAMDLVMQISTTFPEGMSLAPIEAMALAKPVIVTDIPGYANIVEHEKTGFIVPAGETAVLAKLICMLADDRDLARRLGKNARQRVLDNFEYGIVVRQVEDVYQQLLGI